MSVTAEVFQSEMSPYVPAALSGSAHQASTADWMFDCVISVMIVKLNSSAAMLFVLPASVKVSAATLIVQGPDPVDVNVAVYVVPAPLKFESVPFDTVISACSKFVVLSEDVNVNENVASNE